MTKERHKLQNQSVIILGAGPTGLGAAHRLLEIGDVDVRLFDENSVAGGLASSCTDSHGFTWDIGGHVLFSHYEYFDRLMDELLGDGWLTHDRESWVWMRDRFIPYPLQNNIHFLPRAEFLSCFRGLLRAQRGTREPPRHFADWIERSFGKELAASFMRPYNEKVWAYPLEELSFQWVGERVATVDVRRIIANARENREDKGWGPNNRFRFPVRGGTGAIWKALAGRLPRGVFHPGRRCVHVNTARRRVTFEDGSREQYDQLISTIPLDVLVRIADIESLKPLGQRLRYSTTHVVGVGLIGQTPVHLRKKCWMYFPENNSPFYRATVFSNYSPFNVPDASRFWSLMTEVAESQRKPVPRAALVESVIDGLLATGLIDERASVFHTWFHSVSHGYPTPFVGRDEIVHPMLAEFESRGVYSRGRFGGWKYEVSNQDHALMQGVELVNRLALGVPEETYWFPSVVNDRKPRGA
jgi:protoporphyrinogen oxidase